jgi:8-oxo-dGTP diphosphatase
MNSSMTVAIAVVERDGRYLVGRRSAHLPLGGLWEFPGGKVEADETPRAAATRECQEETGLRVRASHCLLVHQQSYSHATITLHFIACELCDPTIQPHTPFEWIARGDLAQLHFPAGNAPLLKLLLGC